MEIITTHKNVDFDALAFLGVELDKEGLLVPVAGLRAPLYPRGFDVVGDFALCVVCVFSSLPPA